MRFLYVKLTGYIGIYNGLGLSSIEIDFSKARNKICIISGPNGVGKSTLNNALNILPDGNENFVPSMAASKYIKLTNGVNIYDITINHPIDKNNNRSVSKASIIKDGVELNPNGNISSYKEIIFSEFNLDSNYIILSKISGDNRGLADKRPAERKKIISSLIASLEVYNDIYKNLNKKANIFKSYINNLSSKIQNIGDESNLRTTSLSIDSKILKIQELIDKSKEEITKSQTIVSMNDPDGSMQSKYDSLIKTIKELDEDKNLTYRKLSKLQDTIDNKLDYQSVLDLLSSTKKRIDDLTEENNSNKNKSTLLLDSISSCKVKIDKLEISIRNISDKIDIELKSSIDKYKRKLYEIETEFSQYNISDYDTISKTEVDYLINFLTKFISNIDNIYSEMNSNMFELYYKIKVNNEDINEKIVESKRILEGLESSKEGAEKKLQEVNNDIFICSDLSKRPKNCKDDKCPFVNSALKVVSKYGSIDKMNKLKYELEKAINKSEQDIKSLTDYIVDMEKLYKIYVRFESLFDLINANKDILNIFSITDITDKNRFLKLVKNEYRFNNLRELDRLYSLSNSISEYKSIKKIMNELDKEYAIQLNNESIKSTYESELNELNEEIIKLKEQYNNINSQVIFNSNLISNLSNKYNRLIELESLYNKWQSDEDKLSELKSEAEVIKNKFDSSFEMISKISELKDLIVDSNSQLKPLLDQKRIIESQLTMLDSFKSEYDMYTEKYMIIDKLRKYSSPTQGSIQSLFMSIYMDKTLSMVNQLLSMIFNGQYQILDYVINENEFRIPFVGNGMPVDDISSGSTSQVCIMGTIINLVLYNMGASDFGIASLDEVDGGLDQSNRYLFVDVIQKICDILHIDQLFTISHSIESALSAVDVILLSDSEEYMDLFSNANIIYRFERKQ